MGALENRITVAAEEGVKTAEDTAEQQETVDAAQKTEARAHLKDRVKAALADESNAQVGVDKSASEQLLSQVDEMDEGEHDQLAEALKTGGPEALKKFHSARTERIAKTEGTAQSVETIETPTIEEAGLAIKGATDFLREMNIGKKREVVMNALAEIYNSSISEINAMRDVMRSQVDKLQKDYLSKVVGNVNGFASASDSANRRHDIEFAQAASSSKYGYGDRRKEHEEKERVHNEAVRDLTDGFKEKVTGLVIDKARREPQFTQILSNYLGVYNSGINKIQEARTITANYKKKENPPIWHTNPTSIESRYGGDAFMQESDKWSYDARLGLPPNQMIGVEELSSSALFNRVAEKIVQWS